MSAFNFHKDDTGTHGTRELGRMEDAKTAACDSMQSESTTDDTRFSVSNKVHIRKDICNEKNQSI